ncbi:hypothetical protein [Corynebacterium halotolerans]|uniref:hypothetical protein n=1 Tax=Corynebacterium halotolerans TaxID=225326 RepID=UPI000A611EC1|nr:hypothetical protein [Corynebacterium halotolerans]
MAAPPQSGGIEVGLQNSTDPWRAWEPLCLRGGADRIFLMDPRPDGAVAWGNGTAQFFAICDAPGRPAAAAAGAPANECGVDAAPDEGLVLIGRHPRGGRGRPRPDVTGSGARAPGGGV